MALSSESDGCAADEEEEDDADDDEDEEDDGVEVEEGTAEDEAVWLATCQLAGAEVV